MSFINSHNVCKVAQHPSIGSSFSLSPKTYLQKQAHRCLIDLQNTGGCAPLPGRSSGPAPFPARVTNPREHARRRAGTTGTRFPRVFCAGLELELLSLSTLCYSCEVLWLRQKSFLNPSDHLQ